MKVAITGASGFLGRRLAAALQSDGHATLSIGRSDSSDVQWNPSAGTLDPTTLDVVDAVVHLAGESIGGDRFLGRQWDEAKKQSIMQSRIDGTGLIARTMAAMASPPKVLVSMSAQGYYGSRGDEILTEVSGPGDSFFADVCETWENATQPAADAGIRVVTTRTGIVVSDEAEAFRRLLIPARLGAGALGSGMQWWAMVSLTDVLRVLQLGISDDSLAGPVNVVSPEPIRQKDLAKAVGRRIGRPAIIPAPVFGLKMLLGGEFVDNVLMSSARVIPAKLQQHGYSFSHPTIDGMLKAELRD